MDDSTLPENALKTPKSKQKSREGLHLKRVNIDRIKTQLMNVLMRDTKALLLYSHKSILDKNQSQSLVNYLKLLKELEKIDLLKEENMSIEELTKIANG